MTSTPELIWHVYTLIISEVLQVTSNSANVDYNDQSNLFVVDHHQTVPTCMVVSFKCETIDGILLSNEYIHCSYIDHSQKLGFTY